MLKTRKRKSVEDRYVDEWLVELDEDWPEARGARRDDLIQLVERVLSESDQSTVCPHCGGAGGHDEYDDDMDGYSRPRKRRKAA
jgi:hypothetical protein